MVENCSVQRTNSLANLGEGPNYFSNSEDCLHIIIIINIIYFYFFIQILCGPIYFSCSYHHETGMSVLLQLRLL